MNQASRFHPLFRGLGEGRDDRQEGRALSTLRI